MDLKKFVEQKLDNLIKISITERQDKGFGAIFVNWNSETEKVDCRYIELGHELFIHELRNSFLQMKEKNPSSFIYFVLLENNACEVIQFDLEKK